MTNLRTTIARLADEFAAGILEAIRGASLEEIIEESAVARPRPRTAAAKAPAGAKASRARRLGRRSASDIDALVNQIVRLLAKHPAGLRAEQLREALEVEAKELPRPLAEALSTRQISKQGQKRATTYFAKSAGAARKADAEAPGGSAGAGRGKAATKGRTGRGRGKRRGPRRPEVAAGPAGRGSGATLQ